MKVKLDENLGHRVKQVFLEAGLDVSSVLDQGLSGQPDERIFDVCRDENRVLVTLDHDFGNLVRFPVEECAGVVLLENPVQASLELLTELARVACEKLKERSVRGKLWIVEVGRIRERPASGD